MFSHVHLGVSDFERALAFYRQLMPVLGVRERYCEPERPWAGWQSEPGPRPLFLIGRPHDAQAHAVGNGQMVAFLADSRDTVDRAHAVALANGGRCEGPPGPRPGRRARHPSHATVGAPVGGIARARSSRTRSSGGGSSAGRAPA